MQHLLWLAGLCLVSSLPAAGQTAAPKMPKPIRKPLAGIQAKAFEAHVRYLADDRLQGRQPGTPGYRQAANYAADQLRKYGVEPAGDNGTYLQTVRLRRAFTEPGATLRLQAAGSTLNLPLTYGTDFTCYPNPGETSTQVEAPVVFAGLGISAPELGYDDYAGLDAQGKMVVVTRGIEPRQFPDAVRLYNTDLLTVLQTAVRHGAVGVLLASVKPAARLPEASRGQVSVLGTDGRVAVSRTYAGPQLRVVGSVSAATLHQLFMGAATDTARALASLRAGRPASVGLVGQVAASQRSRHQDFESYNVVGKISGSDPALREEYVVHTAHLDHLGVGPAVQGDSIYNGAHDNATGVASVLEIAGAYRRLRTPPRRSVLLALVTGEELGLLGSAYLAQHPPAPPRQLVANINTDMPTIIAPLLSVVPLGAENSSLAAPVAEAARLLGLTVEADPEPAQNRFIRSDQYSFVAQGVPAVHIKYGNRTADGQNNLSQLVQAWRARTYHKPQDDLNGQFDWQAGQLYTRLNFLLGYLVANDAKRPTWNEGNFFGESRL
ncbi:M28 family peptidase [Hymenobacter weizhouensis]|uniref:M28 family peptidase n=1 Tax=Hymenobacter sp. YIM 151500-1 TaxID=2987689 RepID=UPI002227CAD0|nr:M28 family peptidase [Hymenobacter sp. YIM 151500-1]UYZ64415.1 M28 family peptidase [Hymenobacter sp. YIM 151500-1]